VEFYRTAVLVANCAKNPGGKSSATIAEQLVHDHTGSSQVGFGAQTLAVRLIGRVNKRRAVIAKRVINAMTVLTFS
jgi:hypothetical protein